MTLDFTKDFWLTLQSIQNLAQCLFPQPVSSEHFFIIVWMVFSSFNFSAYVNVTHTGFLICWEQSWMISFAWHSASSLPEHWIHFNEAPRLNCYTLINFSCSSYIQSTTFYLRHKIDQLNTCIFIFLKTLYKFDILKVQ